MNEGKKCWDVPIFQEGCRSSECGERCRPCEHDEECNDCPFYGCVKYPLVINKEGEIKSWE